MKKAKKILAILLALIVVMGCSMTAFAATELTESESNDTYSDADTMGLANKIKAVLDDADDVDYFSFEIANPCLITVNIEHAAITAATSTYFKVEVINANGEDVMTFKSEGKDAKTSSAPFAAEKGTYYVAVSMGQSHSSTLEYTLSATIDTTANTEKEPNDLASKATALTLSTSGSKKQYYGTIVNKDDPETEDVVEADVDYFSLDIPAPGAIYFYLYNGSSAKGNYKATLYAYLDGANGQPVAKSLGSIDITSNEASVISPSVGVNGGNYLLKIEGVNGCVGGYQTRVYYLTDDNSEYEYNNVQDHANFVSTNSLTYGSIFDKADVDFYKFNVTDSNNGVKVKLAVNAADKDIEGQWTVSIIAPNKSVIAKFDATNTKAAEKETEKLEAGQYYIKVETGNVLSAGLYELSVTAKPAAAPTPDEPDSPSFIDQIKDLPWGDFVGNFAGWFENINVLGILTSILASVAQVFTYLFSMG